MDCRGAVEALSGRIVPASATGQGVIAEVRINGKVNGKVNGEVNEEVNGEVNEEVNGEVNEEVTEALAALDRPDASHWVIVRHDAVALNPEAWSPAGHPIPFRPPAVYMSKALGAEGDGDAEQTVRGDQEALGDLTAGHGTARQRTGGRLAGDRVVG